MTAASPTRLVLGTATCSGVVLMALRALAAVGQSSLALPVALLLLASLALNASLLLLWALRMRRNGLPRRFAARRSAAARAAVVGGLAGVWFWLELDPVGSEAFPSLGPLWHALVGAGSLAIGLAAGTAYTGVERVLAPLVRSSRRAVAARARSAGRAILGVRTDRLAPFIALAIFLAIASYGRSLETPVNRDSGQYLYVAQVILDGGAPYVDAANNKGPVTYLLFAAISLVAGGSSALVSASLIPFTALASLALAAFVSRSSGRVAGLAAGVALAYFAAPEVLGDSDPNTEHYGLAGMAGALWLAGRRSPLSPALAGALTALTALLNLWFLFMVPFVAFELWRTRDRDSRSPTRFVRAALGGLAVCAAVLGWIWLEGALGEMVALMGDSAGASVGPTAMRSDVFYESLPSYLDLPYFPAWVLGVGGSLIAVSDRRLRSLALVSLLWVVVLWARGRLTSYSYDHHFFPATIGLATGIGLLASWISRHRSVAALALVAGLLILTAASSQIPETSYDRDRTAKRLPEAASKARPARSPWELAAPVASFVRGNTDKEDTLFVAGSVASVYWLAERRSPTPFFDIYPWLQRPGNRAKLARDLDREPPTAVAFLPEWISAPVPDYVEELFARHRYREAFRIDEARVWLRSQPRPGR